MKKITAVLADIDATLVERGCAMSPITTAALNRLHETGVLIGIASGRPVNEQMRRKAKDWNLNFEFDALIGMNGGQLWDKDHEGTENINLLSKETVKDIVELMAPLRRNAFVYHGDHLLAMELDELMQGSADRNEMEVEVTGYDDPSKIYSEDRNKLLYRMQPEDTDDTLAYLEKQPKDDRFQYFMCGPGILEFQDPHNDKGYAVVKYAERNNIPLDEILVLGDEQNDLKMIELAGWGVCMANGCEECKEAADEITEYEAKDAGAGRYIFDHILHEAYSEE